MSKLELINFNIKNSKLDKSSLKMICNCFVDDLTASQTAQKVGLSRQTINNYYKIIRTHLIENQNFMDTFFLLNSLNKETITIKYFLFNSNAIFYIQKDSMTYFLDETNMNLRKLNSFLQSSLKDSFLKHKRANCARVLFNKTTKEYYLSSFLKSSNNAESFITTRLKKFRGINKNNYSTHINESFMRYNYKKESLLKIVYKIFNI